jgi:hypothetical protein
MPNWCQNEVSIYGDKEDIEKLKAEVFTVDEVTKQSYLDFNKVIPMPKELEDSVSPPNVVSDEILRMRDLLKANPSIQSIWVDGRQIKDNHWSEKFITESQSEILKKTYGADNWYHWRITNWGTKWGIDGESIQFYDEDENRIELHFDTAWSPPNQIYQELRDKYEDIEISWFYREDGEQFAGYMERD